MVLEDAVCLDTMATAGSEQALGSLPGHRRAAAVPVQSSMGVEQAATWGASWVGKQ